MTDHAIYVPASEALRFCARVLLRLVIAVAAGLVFLKAGRILAGWSAEEAVLYSKIAVGVLFFGSMYVARIPWPETAYKGSDKAGVAE